MALADALDDDAETLANPAASRVLFCGKSLIADPSGALYWPAERTLIVADLRLERGSYLAEPDAMMPPFDTASALEKLDDAVACYDPARVVALGHSFCGEADRRLSPRNLDWLQDIMEDRQWLWLAADDAPRPPKAVGGVVQESVTLSGIKFRHAPLPVAVSHEISGSMHPVACFRQHGVALRGRCFLTNGKRLIMPSAGQYSAGTNVLADAFDPLLGRDGVFVWAIHSRRVEALAPGLLLEGAAASGASAAVQ